MRRRPIFRWLLVQFLAVILLVTASLAIGWSLFFFRQHLIEDAGVLKGRMLESFRAEAVWVVEEMVRAAEHERMEVAEEAAQALRDRLTVLAAEFDREMRERGAEPFAQEAVSRLRPLRFDGLGGVVVVDREGRVRHLTGHPEAEGVGYAEASERWLRGSGPGEEMLGKARELGVASTVGGVSEGNEMGPSDMAHAVHIPGLDWVVCGMISKREQEEAAQKRVLRRLARTGMHSGRGVFAATWEGIGLTPPDMGVNRIDAKTPDGRQIVREMIDLSKAGGGFIEYRMPAPGGGGSVAKVSLVRGIPEWGWYIGSGFDQGEVEKPVADLLHAQGVALWQAMGWSVAAVVGALVIGGFLAYRIADGLRREFVRFQEGFAEAAVGAGRMNLEALQTEELVLLGVAANEMFERRKASEGRFRSMFDASPMGVLIYRLNEADELRFVGGNAAAAKVLGVPFREKIGCEILEIFPALAGTPVPEAFRRVAREGGVWAMESIAYEEGGTKGVFEVFAFQVFQMEVAVFFLEISEREQSRRALRESEERFRTIVETAYEGILTLGPDWRMTFANRRLGELLGCPAEELIGCKIDDFVHPSELADHAERVGRRERGVAERYERRFVRKDGGMVTMLVSATPILGEGGEFKGSFAMLVDISEQKRSAEVIASLARFPTENPSPVVRLSRRGVLLYANPGAKALLEGLKGAVGMPLPDHFRNMALKASGAGAEAERKFEIEAGGRHYSLIAFAVGDREYVNVYGFDVTEQRQLEEQVRQAQKMEAIGRLAGGVAHDFNNMLQAILGFVDVTRDYVERGVDPNPALEEIEKAGKRAAELTRQLLAFGRRQMLRPRPVDINEKISDLMKMLRRIISEDIALQFVPGEGVGSMMGDPVQIDQVLLNLAVNARDALPNGGRIVIETRDAEVGEEGVPGMPEMKPGRYVLLSFADSGCGMSEEVQRHLFEPFFTTKEMGRGTGLGLATVYGIIGQHGGTIGVESEPGVGTAFRMYFPVTDRRVADVLRQSVGNAPGGEETILVAEDDAGVRAALKITLESVGYRVLEAEDGLRALEVLREREGEIRLAMLDVVMPGMGGVELQRIIARDYPRLAVLFSSGYTAQDPQSDAIAASGLELIQKPYDREVLLQAVRRTLDGGQERMRGQLFTEGIIARGDGI